MSPVAFKDINKSADGVINSRDVNFDRKFKIKTLTANKIELTTEGILGGKGATGSMAAKFSPADGITVDKLSVNTAGRLVAEASLNNAIDGGKFVVTAEDGGNKAPAGTFAIKYGMDNLAMETKVDVVEGPTLYSCATLGYDSFVFGGEVKYHTQYDDKNASPGVVDYNFGVHYKAPDFTAALKTKKKASVMDISMHHDVCKSTAVASSFVYDTKKNSKSLSVGGTYKLDSSTSFLGTVDSNATATMMVTQKVTPAVKLIASAQVDAKNLTADSHKFGLSLIMG